MGDFKFELLDIKEDALKAFQKLEDAGIAEVDEFLKINDAVVKNWIKFMT